jgi:Methyltransferase domain/C-methyltransferase C-terminal domain
LTATSCPVCSSERLTAILRRERLPVMQNVSYASRPEALASPCAPFELAGCGQCGFFFNSRFDPSLFSYDMEYDNHVESRAFHRYYESVAAMLIERFDLASGGEVYDVGCGQGTFLKVLCAMAPKVRGVGIDPSCTPLESGNLRLIQSVFSRELIGADAKLILLRHVLEHIERPVEFLTLLRAVVRKAPVYVEVPEAGWIFSNGAFWDFCYEHCNYFVPQSLSQALTRAGFSVHEQAPSFEGQYQWAICSAARGDLILTPGSSLDVAQEYARREATYFEKARSSLAAAGARGACAIWGMATKGVVLATILPGGLIEGGVDSNSRKQGRFAPGSGLAIHAPSWLARFDGAVTALVMNPNYYQEIRQQLVDLHIAADLSLL